MTENTNTEPTAAPWLPISVTGPGRRELYAHYVDDRGKYQRATLGWVVEERRKPGRGVERRTVAAVTVGGRLTAAQDLPRFHRIADEYNMRPHDRFVPGPQGRNADLKRPPHSPTTPARARPPPRGPSLMRSRWIHALRFAS